VTKTGPGLRSRTGEEKPGRSAPRLGTGGTAGHLLWFLLILAEVLLCGAACLTGLNAVLLAIAGGPAIGFGLSVLLCAS
jgi:hypothetical protein